MHPSKEVDGSLVATISYSLPLVPIRAWIDRDDEEKGRNWVFISNEGYHRCLMLDARCSEVLFSKEEKDPEGIFTRRMKFETTDKERLHRANSLRKVGRILGRLLFL